MSTDDSGFIWELAGTRVTRRNLMKGAAVLGGTAAFGSVLVACGEEETADEGAAAGEAKQGGSLRVGIVGGSAKDTADPHTASFEPDIAIQYQVYDGLTGVDENALVVNRMAEEITPNADGSVWTCRLREGLTWHDGAPVTADDVVYTFERIVDPADPKTGVATLAGLSPGGTVKIDERTVEFRLDPANVIFPEGLSFRGNQVVPVDFDPANPIGCGPFKLTGFRPGEQFTFAPFEEFWGGRPYVDDLTIIEFADETARVNALMSGEVEAISEVPRSQTKVVEGAGMMVLNAETGAWRPFTMRIDVKPFDDVRVRQAFRLIVDRQQMIDQAYGGFGGLGNDMYARYDPGTPDLPQRAPDIEQAKALLAEAGYGDGLSVELVTSAGALGADEVAAAQVFAEQAKAAGVTVKVKKVDAGVFYGEDYLSWPFAQDFWYARGYLAQAGQGTMPGAPYNETHWDNPEWLAIVQEALSTVDEAQRNELIGEAQTIEYNEGGYIIWAFRNQVDGYAPTIAGLKEDKLGAPLGQFAFKDVYFV